MIINLLSYDEVRKASYYKDDDSTESVVIDFWFGLAKVVFTYRTDYVCNITAINREEKIINLDCKPNEVITLIDIFRVKGYDRGRHFAATQFGLFRFVNLSDEFSLVKIQRSGDSDKISA